MANGKNGAWKKISASIGALLAIPATIYGFSIYFVSVDAFEGFKKESVIAMGEMQQATKFNNYDFYVDSLERDEKDCNYALKRNPNDLEKKSECEELAEKRKEATKKRDALRDALLE